jgi:hypothetical protein
MKYRDIRFEKHRDKQVFGDFEKSSRQLRREYLKRHDNFYRLVLGVSLSRLYWDNLTDSDKDSIIDKWNYLSLGFHAKYDAKFKRCDLSFIDWIRQNYVIDKVGYRDDVLKVLGI